MAIGEEGARRIARRVLAEQAAGGARVEEIVGRDSRVVVQIDDFGDEFDGCTNVRGDQAVIVLDGERGQSIESLGRRQRFSLAHEYGHFRIPQHARTLRRHPGPGPFGRALGRVELQMEREANAFAAELLLPTQILRPRVCERELDWAFLEDARDEFDVSLTAMCLQAIRLADSPQALLVLRGHRVAWGWASDSFRLANLWWRAQAETARLGTAGEAAEFEEPAANWLKRAGDSALESLRVTVRQRFGGDASSLVLLALDESDLP